MTKAKCFLLALTLTLVACSGSGGGSSKEVALADRSEITPGNTQTPSGPEDTTVGVPKAAITFSTNLELVNATRNQEDKLQRAIEIVKLVVATESFRTQILNHTYNGKKTFVDNNGLSNEEIYHAILEAAETLQPTKNNIMDMEVELYTAGTNVVGYTYPNTKRIWVNTKYFDTYTAAGVAHNLMHEWTHKLGFGHDSAATASRPYSVPYAVGYIVAEIGQDFL